MENKLRDDLRTPQFGTFTIDQPPDSGGQQSMEKAMTKTEAVRKLYGDNPTFSFDYALPQPLLDEMVTVLTGYHTHVTDSDKIAQIRADYYATLYTGCVYAYCKESGNAGLLPLTSDARRDVYHYAELICEMDARKYGKIRRFFHTFTPTVRI